MRLKPHYPVNAKIIDKLVEYLRKQSAPDTKKATNADLPQRQDVRAMAAKAGLKVSRKSDRTEPRVIYVPEFYSEREARLSIARQLAKHVIDAVETRCRVDGDTHDCPDADVCELVRDANSNPKTLDSVAAAVLMPTDDFSTWAAFFNDQIQPLAETYGVPAELAGLRLQTLGRDKEAQQ